ncbi:MAG: hypothetical protein K5675_03295 [Lachnospiraceae bacterium]|nr:hypothetical protein [Lachnospiraceae bacterium]
MAVTDILDLVKKKAKEDETFKQALLHTKDMEKPVTEFCKICTENGFELSAFELVTAGEDAYAAMKRSTNGGGENSPLLEDADDLYGMFLLELE